MLWGNGFYGLVGRCNFSSGAKFVIKRRLLEMILTVERYGVFPVIVEKRRGRDCVWHADFGFCLLFGFGEVLVVSW